MPAKGFQVIAIEAKRHRKSSTQKQVRIDHNTTILSVRKASDTDLSVEMRYTVSYGLLGTVQLDCEIKFFEKEKKEIQKIMNMWEKNHKLPDGVAETIHNRVLAQGSFEVLNIAKKLNLPPPFKIEIPQIKIGKQNSNTTKKDNSPEIA